jgi:hypothetical protein
VVSRHLPAMKYPYNLKYPYNPVSNTLTKPIKMIGSKEVAMTEFCYECGMPVEPYTTFPSGAIGYHRCCLWPEHQKMGEVLLEDTAQNQ